MRRGLVDDAHRFLQLTDAGLTTDDDPVEIIRSLVAHFEKHGYADRAAHEQQQLKQQIVQLQHALDEEKKKSEQIPHLKSLIEGLERRVSEANDRTRIVEHTNVQLEQLVNETAQRQTPPVRHKK
jgi:predicted RNase H-like nuclease (RuvC/YqgF family)